MARSGDGEGRGRRPWSAEEDKRLVEAVDMSGPSSWKQIADHVGTRKDFQCCERWRNILSPDVNKQPWTAREDAVIVHQVEVLGSSWSATAKLLQGRTANAVKNRYNLSRRTRQRAHRILSRLGSKSSGTTAPADGEPADRGHSRATSEAAGRAFAPPLVHAISGLRPPDQLYGRLAAAAPMLIQAAGCYVSPSGAFDGAARAQRPELGRLFSVPPVRPCVERTLSAQSNYNVLNTLVTATPLFRPGVVPGVPLEHAYAGHAAAPRGGNYAYHISAAHPLTPRQGHAPRPASFPSAAELAARLHAADHPLPADDSIVRGFLMELFRGTNGHVNLDAAADVMSALGFSDCAAK